MEIEEIDEIEPERTFDRIKRHIRENRKVYIGAGIGALVGAAGMAIFMTRKYGGTTTTADLVDSTMSQLVAQQIDGTNNTQHIKYQTISIYGNKIGRPGIPVWDMTEGKRYESLSLAAEAIGAKVNNIRQQLHGRTDHVNGHVFQLAETE